MESNKKYQTIINLSACAFSFSMAVLFFVNTLKNLEVAKLLTEDSTNKLNSISAKEQLLYSTNIILAAILCIGNLRASDKLMRDAVKFITKEEIPLGYTACWSNSRMLGLSYVLAASSTFYMSGSIGLNLVNVVGEYTKSNGVKLPLGILGGLFSAVALWAYFIFKARPPKESIANDQGLDSELPNKVRHLLVGIITYGYVLGNSFLFINTLKLFINSYTSNKFGFNMIKNTKGENTSLLLITVFAGLPALHILGQTYYNLLAKGFALRPLHLIKPTSANKKNLHLGEKLYVALVRSLVLSLSILILSTTISTKKHIAWGLAVASIPSVVAFAANFVGRAALYIAAANQSAEKAPLLGQSRQK